ncbi:hypothetical protein [Dactylosporangium sp. NPDC051541]|uniref:hypothetical protein n=1 Tax=Dactylosporangium sp. NPDC051541 TaxID=3363977 RepID=UPI00378E5AC3
MSRAVWHVVDVKPPPTADRLATGAVWFTLHGVAFPEAGWTDLPVSVLSSAVTAYEDISRGAPDAFSYFFDGPYFLYYHRTDAPEPTVHIEANCDRDEHAVISLATGEVPLKDLRDALLNAVESLQAAIAATPHAEASTRITAKLIAKLTAPTATVRQA